MPEARNIFTFELDARAQERLRAIVEGGNYVPRETPYALWSVESGKVNVTLYEKEKRGLRKLVVQGKGAQDFVSFVLEPQGVVETRLGYEDVLDPAFASPRGGSDESGKGDYFGPLAVCCAYADGELSKKMAEIGVRDCKQMSDASVMKAAAALRGMLGADGFSEVVISPQAYNRLYAKIRNANAILAWAHATAIEGLLEKKPGIEFVTIDQFAPTEATILRALKPLGKKSRIVQRHKAESDMAVAAASVIARASFLSAMAKISESLGAKAPLGASNPAIADVAAEAVRKNGPNWLMNNAKVQFRTTDSILERLGMGREDLPPEGRVKSMSSEQNWKGSGK